MNGILFAESIEIEFKAIYEACDNAVAYANARLMEDGLIPSYYSEAEDKKSGGLVGFLSNMIKSIGTLLSEAGKKIKSLLFGSEIDDSKKDEKVNGKDANAITKFLNGYYKDGKDILEKASQGKVSVEEAKKFTSDKDAAWGAIGTVVTTAGALLVSTKAHEKYINSWKAEIDELYDLVEIERDGKKVTASIDAEHKLTKTGSNEGREDIIKQTTQIILNHMSKTSGFGIKAIEENIKMLYAKNYIRAKLEKGEKEFTDPEAAKAMKKQAKADVKATDKFVDQTEDEIRQIEATRKEKEKISESRKQNIARQKNIINARYTDADYHVDKEDLQRDNYLVKDQIQSAVGKAKDDTETGFKRLKRNIFRNNKKEYK